MIKRMLVISIVLAGIGVAIFGNIARAATEAEVKSNTANSIRKIYEQLVAKKDVLEVLGGISESEPKADELGWPYLEYSQTSADGRRFYLLVRALPSSGFDFHSKLEGYREFTDTLLDVKFMVYVNNPEALGRLDIYEMVKEASTAIYPEEGDNSPLKMSVVPSQNEYKLRDKIEFEVFLRNEGNVGLKLRKLDESSTNCYFNGSLWGMMDSDSKPASSSRKEVVLSPGQSFQKRFSVRVEKRGRLEIRCTYGLRFMGNLPTARAFVDIR